MLLFWRSKMWYDGLADIAPFFAVLRASGKGARKLQQRGSCHHVGKQVSRCTLLVPVPG